MKLCTHAYYHDGQMFVNSNRHLSFKSKKGNMLIRRGLPRAGCSVYLEGTISHSEGRVSTPVCYLLLPEAICCCSNNNNVIECACEVPMCYAMRYMPVCNLSRVYTSVNCIPVAYTTWAERSFMKNSAFGNIGSYSR